MKHNIEKEKQIIGAMFHRPDLIPRIAELVWPTDFHNPDYQKIYEQILGTKVDEPIEIVNFPEFYAEITDAMNQVVSPESAYFYAIDVAKLSRYRKMEASAENLKQAIANGGNVKEALEQLIANSEKKTVDEYKMLPISDMVSEESDEKRYPIGFSTLEWCLMDEDLIGKGAIGGIALGEFVAVAGRPKNGKTLFAAQITAGLVSSDLNALWLSYEGKMSKLKKILDRVGCREKSVIGIQCDKGVPLLSRIDWVEAQLKRAIRDFGVKILVIDNLDFLEVKEGQKVNGEYETMKIVITALAKIAVTYNIILILLAHVRKPSNSAGAPKRPRMYDISGTSQLDRLCDIGFIVDRDKKDEDTFSDTTTIYLENNRPSGLQRKTTCLYHQGKLIDVLK